MKKVMISSFMALICTSSQAQDFYSNTWQETGTGTWSTNVNWKLLSGTQALPDNEFGEYALINNGGTSVVSSEIGPTPYAIFIGQEIGQSGTLNIAGGTLAVDAADLDDGTFTPLNVGKLVVGLLGSGTVNVSAGTLDLDLGLLVGAGGGEGGLFTMTGGNVIIPNGDFDLRSRGTFNMSGGTFNIESADQKWWDIGGAGGGIAVANLSGTATFNTLDVVSNVNVGSFNGSGQLMISGGATLNVSTLNVSNTKDTVLSLSGNATLNVTGNANIWQRLRITGTQVNATVAGNLQLNDSAVFNPVINDASNHSAVSVTGSVTLGGTLDLEFEGGVTPDIGDSWDLITGTIAAGGKFDRILGPSLAKGVRYGIDTSNNSVAVNVESALTLHVNTVAGSSSIVDYIGDTEIVSYVIRSKNGAFNVAGWNSMSDAAVSGWEESSPREAVVSELNLHETTKFTSGQSHDLGGLIADFDAILPFGISAPGDEFTMTYKTIDGETHDAIIEVTSLKNNLVLTVDPETGMATLQNHSLSTIELVSYVVESDAGSLDSSGWDSMADQNIDGWEEASPTENHLSELNLNDLLVLNPGQIISLGSLMTLDAIEDLELEFRLNDAEGSILDGVVVYGDLAIELAGDYDFDGDVDADDLAIVANGFGDIFTLSDVFAVRNNYGAEASSGAVAVPEPASIALLGMGLIFGIRRKK